jgi:hypothetical protein
VASKALIAWKYTSIKLRVLLGCIKYIKQWKKEFIPQSKEDTLHHLMKDRA